MGETIIDWDIVGLKAEPRAKRVYPEGDMGAHLLGFVNSNGNGFYGVEGFYDDMLRGKAGLQTGERSPFGEIIPSGRKPLRAAHQRRKFYLTVDRSVQHMIETELKTAVNAVRRSGRFSGDIAA